MTWYAASVLIAIRRVDLSSAPWLVYENVILVEALDAAGARKQASDIANREVSVDDDFTLDGHSAIKKFAGIRKLINVSNPDPYDLDQDRPVSGTEITYSVFEISDDDALAKLANGEELTIKYIE